MMQTNGGSLEDCYTNVFALTELNGLRWKCFTTPLSAQRNWTGVDHDPILVAYSKCLESGLLCAWRRLPPGNNTSTIPLLIPDYRIDVVKELWVFWYTQDEPEQIFSYTNHLSCNENSRGNWSVPGIQYQTRVIFFKALHNLIERYLIRNEYIRIGRYFTRPYDISSADRMQCSPNYITGISFNFFIHGENTVCTTVNIQRQPTLFRFSRRHLKNKKAQRLILGPWSLRATLVPDQPHIIDDTCVHLSGDRGIEREVSDSHRTQQERTFGNNINTIPPSSSAFKVPGESQTTAGNGYVVLKSTIDKLWHDWQQFSLIPASSRMNEPSSQRYSHFSDSYWNRNDESTVPSMVLVDVDGTYMWYPSSLIVVQACDDLPINESSSDKCENVMEDMETTSFTRNQIDMLYSNGSNQTYRCKSAKSFPNTTCATKQKYSIHTELVNGARIVQRFLEEACIQLNINRRKDSIEQQTTCGLGLFISAPLADDDNRWNLTDGMRRKERDGEQCFCRICQMTAFTTSLPTTSQSQPQAFFGFSNDLKKTNSTKECVQPFHHRSRLNETSSSPPLSFVHYDCDGSSTSEKAENNYEGDWIHANIRHSSVTAGKFNRIDLIQDERCHYPDSPICSPSVMNRRVDYWKTSLNACEFENKMCKPVLHGTSGSSSKVRSPNARSPPSFSDPVCSKDDIGCEGQVRSCIAGADFVSANGPRWKAHIKKFQPCQPLSGSLGKDIHIDKIVWRNIQECDVLKVAADIGEDCSVDPYCLSPEPVFSINPYANSPKARKTVSFQDTAMESVSDSHTLRSSADTLPHDVLRWHSSRLVKSVDDSVSAAHRMDNDFLCSFLTTCSPSNMVEHNSPIGQVVDSVHLSPPASNENVDSLFTAINGAAASLSARVCGPPSVGDYKIYPTPPSVDAFQSQQFSPQNATGFPSNSTSQLPGTNSMSYATVLADNLAENSKMESGPKKGISCCKLEMILKDRPVYGGTQISELPVSGRFASIKLRGEIPSARDIRGHPVAHTDQDKSINVSIALRRKRRRTIRPPDYLSLKEHLQSLSVALPANQHYKLPYNISSHAALSNTFCNAPVNALSCAYGPIINQAPSNNPVLNAAPRCTGSVVQPHIESLNEQMSMNSMILQSRLGLYPSHTHIHGHENIMHVEPSNTARGSIVGTHMSKMAVHSVNSLSVGQPVPTMMGVGGFTDHIQASFQAQPFHQLTQFVNNGNFADQQSIAMNASHPLYHQQAAYRYVQQEDTQLVQYHSSLNAESQCSTPIEPPPSFSQAIGSQYPSMSNICSMNPIFYSPSSRAARVCTSSTNSHNVSVMMTSLQPVHNSMMLTNSFNNDPGGATFSRCASISRCVERGDQAAARSHPEGKALVLAILLQDTVLDLHYDTVFDSCPICSCCGNIRAREFGMYITPPEILRQPLVQQQLVVNKPTSGFYTSSSSNACTCGFSAVRHRYLSIRAGLFAEDAKEATDITESPNQPVIPHTIWFDSMSGRDMNFIALLREQTLVRDLAGIMNRVCYLSMQCEKAVQIERYESESSKQSEYIISEADQRELPLVFQAACEIACMEMNCHPPSRDVRSVSLHDWGIQIANEMREPRESECLAVLREVSPILEEALRMARSTPQYNTSNIVEGPLTWRCFDRKSLKPFGGMVSFDDDGSPEPVPNLMLGSEKDAITASPQILRMWEKFDLEPYDQAKNILYIGVVPDSPVCIEKSKKYFEDLSRVYERCRLGRHVPFNKDSLKDGILRIPSRYLAPNPNDCDNFLNQVERHISDNKSLIFKIKTFKQCFENEIARVLINNDHIFNRETFRSLLSERKNVNNVESVNQEQLVSPHIPVGATNMQLSSLSQGPSIGVGNILAGCIGEPLPPVDANAGENSHATINTNSSQSEQVYDGNIADEESGGLPHVIVLYVVNPFLFGADENPLIARVVTVALMRSFNALLYRLSTRRRPQLQLEIIGLQTIFDYTAVTSDFLKDDAGRLNSFDQGLLEKSMNERMSSLESLKNVAFCVYSQSRIVLPEVVRSILPKCMTRFGPAAAMGDLLNGMDKKEPIFFKVPSKAFILAPPQPVTQRPNGDLMQINADDSVLFLSYCLVGNDWLAASVTDHQGHLLDNCLINLKLKPDHKRVNMRYKQSTQIRDSLYRLWSYILGILATGTKNWRLVIGRLGRIGHGEFKFWTQLLNKSYLKQIGSRMKAACRSCYMISNVTETPGVLSACLVSLEPEAHIRVFASCVQHDERLSKMLRYRSLTTPDDSSCTHILVFPTSPNIEHQGGNAGGELDEDFSNLFTTDMEDEIKDLIGDDDDLMTNSGPPPNSASFRSGGNTGIPNEFSEVSIENQPLATGYYISTAPAAELPDWFWSSCPFAKRRSLVHLKCSLHLNTPNVQQGDDFSPFGVKEACHHQLDSQATVDVLRYVLETYNALSWLNIDYVNGERRSCLPIHIQALNRLCNTVNRLIN